MPLIGSKNLLDLPTFNGKVPNDGPRTIPVPVDFSAGAVWTLDLSLQTQLKIVGFLQCVFVDNKDSNAPIFIRTNTIRQTICIPGRSQGYVPLLLTDSPTVELESASNQKMLLHFMNVPMPLHIWSTLTQPALIFDGNGNLLTSQPAFNALVETIAPSLKAGLNVNIVSGGSSGGAGSRLPSNYAPIRADLDATGTINVIAAAPRFYVNAISVYCDPTAFRTASAGPVTITLYQGVSDRFNRTVNFGGAAVAAVSTPTAVVPIIELADLNWWSNVDGENFRIGLTAGLSQGFFRCTVFGGSGSVPV